MRTINGNIRQLPGAYEPAAAILGALRTNDLYDRPDDYWEAVAPRYRAMTAAGIALVMRSPIANG